MWKAISFYWLFLVVFGFCFAKSVQAAQVQPATYQTVTSVGQVWVYQNKEVDLVAKCSELGGVVDAQQSGCYVGGKNGNISRRYKCSDGAFVEAERLCEARSSWVCPDESWELIWSSKTCMKPDPPPEYCSTLDGLPVSGYGADKLPPEICLSSSGGACEETGHCVPETGAGKGKGCLADFVWGEQAGTGQWFYTGGSCTLPDDEKDEDKDKDKESSEPEGEKDGDKDGDKDGEGDGKGDGEASGGTGEGDGSCPSWLGWLCGSGEGPAGIGDGAGSGEGGKTVDVGKLDTGDKYIGTKQCPLPRKVEGNIAGYAFNFSIPYDYLCEFATYIKLGIIAVALICAAAIIFKG